MPTDTEQVIARRAEDIRLVEDIRWKSADRDNMEFEARVTCYQKDAINRLLTLARQYRGGDETLVDRLRQAIDELNNDPAATIGAHHVFYEAADEIERLRGIVG